MPAVPLNVSAYTALCAAGAGRKPCSQRCAPGAAACGRTTSRRRRWRPGSAGSTDLESLPLHPKAWRAGTAATTGSPGSASAPTASSKPHTWPARKRYGAARVALVLGTSTSSIGATEEAYTRTRRRTGAFRRATATPHRPHAAFAGRRSCSEALRPRRAVPDRSRRRAHRAPRCSRSAERLLRLGLVDAAMVGGVDTLCGSVLFGFNSLRAGLARSRAGRSTRPQRHQHRRSGRLRPARARAAARGAALARLRRVERRAPHVHAAPGGPRRRDAPSTMRWRAPASTASEIDYINLHGTASPRTTKSKRALVARRFPARTHASSTKGLTGHTLGAAGIVEAVISLLAIETGLMPGTVNTAALDAACGPQISLKPARRRGALRAEQFVRIRRQQLLAGLRHPSAALMASHPNARLNKTTSQAHARIATAVHQREQPLARRSRSNSWCRRQPEWENPRWVKALYSPGVEETIERMKAERGKTTERKCKCSKNQIRQSRQWHSVSNTRKLPASAAHRGRSRGSRCALLNGIGDDKGRIRDDQLTSARNPARSSRHGEGSELLNAGDDLHVIRAATSSLLERAM